MKELQALGYLKIMSCFTGELQTDIKSGILSVDKYNVTELGLIKYLLSGGVTSNWVLKFLTFVEPLWNVAGNNLGNDTIVRHFKSRWATLWKGYSEAVGVTEYGHKGLMNLGLVIARGAVHNDDLDTFYEAIVNWYLISSINDTELLDNLLRKLVTLDKREFLDLILEDKL